MSLTSGEKLVSYEILALVGKGGMGEVYRAKDTKLGREVAIKVLPEELALHPERLARFEREARLLATLNHPGIATLHGFESGGSVPFLVMELVPGETLADRIARGPLPLDEVITLFGQIAEALEAAHEKGIVHRDLKPANVKITPEGKIKVLDFGLAKLAASDEDPDPSASVSPTLTKGTALGVILGTAAYMSPEQARGRAVDRRTDVWAFGCCLYEALTGRRAFEGESVTDTLAAVLKSEPRLPASLPPNIRSLLERCLRKDPFWRLRDIGDARLELAQVGSGDEKTREPSSSKAAGVFLVIAGMLAGAALVSLFLRDRAPSPSQSYHFTIPTPISSRNTLGARLAISRDGRSLLVRRDEGIALRRLDRLDERILEGTALASFPQFSPDGEWVLFGQGGELKKLQLDGGNIRSLCSAPDLRSAHWHADDVILFVDRYGLKRIPASGGAPEILLESPDIDGAYGFRDESVVLLAFSPPNEERIELFDPTRGERERLLEGASSPRYATSGHLLFVRSGSLHAVSFDAEARSLAGAPFPVLASVYENPWRRQADYDVSADGTLAYLPPADLDVSTSLVWVDRKGMETRALEGSRPYRAPPDLSPDGNRIAITVLAPPDIWVVDLLRGSHRRVTHSPPVGMVPLWSATGEEIFFASYGNPAYPSIYSIRADGSGGIRQRTAGAFRIPESVTSDGKLLFFRQQDALGRNDIGVLRLDVESDPELILSSRYDEIGAAISPDGRLLAFVSDESGREEVYVTPFPGVGSRSLVSTDGGTEPVWSRDGKEIFYREGNKLMAARLEQGSTPAFAAPSVLFEEDYDPLYLRLAATTQGSPTYDVAHDGRFLMMRLGESPETEIHVIVNWLDELARTEASGG